MNSSPTYTLDFSQIGMQDISRVGGKNSSLWQRFNMLKPQGIGVLDGFATTAEAYRPGAMLRRVC
jgi:pyruvate, water dikinase